MIPAKNLLPAVAALVCSACGGSPPPKTEASAAPPPSEATAATRPCGSADTMHEHDLNADKPTEALVPCSKNGANDYSGVIKIETIPEGVHITINATDDEVDAGALGSDVKTRDAVIVYPKGPGSKAIEVPLVKTKDGYTGDKIVQYDDLDKLTDEGTKLDIAVFDHDAKSGEPSEEMHVSVSVSTGKSCEKAIDENPQTMDFNRSGSSALDLSAAQLGAPMNNGAFIAGCGLGGSANADICVGVKQGRPLGVSVRTTPPDNRVAACIDRRTRQLRFPVSSKFDVVKEHF